VVLKALTDANSTPTGFINLRQVPIMSRLSVCNRLHDAKERLARWFLMVSDRIANDSFYLTHEFLAVIAGSRRTTVTQAAGALHNKGLIHYSRGRIRVADPEGLEKEACECYATFGRSIKASTVACPWLEGLVRDRAGGDVHAPALSSRKEDYLLRRYSWISPSLLRTHHAPREAQRCDCCHS
jgi:hypothetical protein